MHSEHGEQILGFQLEWVSWREKEGEQVCTCNPGAEGKRGGLNSRYELPGDNEIPEGGLEWEQVQWN